MFIHDFLEVEAPQGEIRTRLLLGDGGWLAPLVGAACAHGEDLRVRVGLGVDGLVSKTVEVTVGAPRESHDQLVVPLRWRATGPTLLFPVMEADLAVAPMGDAWTHVSFHGRYEPPLGCLGHTADNLVMHRIAEACVRSFLTKVAGRLVEMDVTGARVEPASGVAWEKA